MHEAAHEAAGVVTAAQGFAGEMDEGGLAEGFDFGDAAEGKIGEEEADGF